MRTRSSSNLPVESPPNPSTSNPKRHNRRHSKQPFILEESPIDTMADQRTMAELLRAPTEGYVEAIVVPLILAEQFELKHSVINMMTSDQFFRLEKDNPRDHIRWFNKITSTIKYKDVPNSAIKLMLFPFSLAGAARRWLEKEPPRSILTWEDLVLKFINEFFPPQEQQISVMKFQTFNNGSLPSNTIANPKGELKAITTQSDIVLDGHYVPIPPPFINLEEDERSLPSNTIANPKGELKAITTQSDIVLDGHYVPIPPPFINLEEDEYALILILKYHKMLKALLSNKEKLLELENTPLNENCSAVILKKSPEKLGDPGKFLIPCGFSELKCKALADLADFVIVDYKSDPRVPLILGRPFLRTARALIDIHGEEMILRDGDERLTLNMRHDTSIYSNQPQKESSNLINVFNDSSEDFLKNLFSTNQPSGNPTFSSHPKLTLPKIKVDVFDPEGGNVLPEKLLDLDFTKDLHPHHHVSTTSSSSPNQLLKEFADELAFITFPPGNDDLSFDIESNLKEIEYLLHQDPIKDMDSILEDSIDQSNLADLNDNLVDTMPQLKVSSQQNTF
nr:reverse transcriptase domain-containing protein [Tanacetum cinerariifolium]